MRYIEKIGRFCSISENVTIGLAEYNTKNITVHPMFDIGSRMFNKYYQYTSENELYATIKKYTKEQRCQKDQLVDIGNDAWIKNPPKYIGIEYTFNPIENEIYMLKEKEKKLICKLN